MIFVIQKNISDCDGFKKVKAAIENEFIPFIEVDIIPFSREIVSGFQFDLTENFRIPYGSTILTEETYKLGWRGNYFDPKTFRADVWTKFRNDMLNNRVTTSVKAVEFLKDVPEDSYWFIRPVNDLKQFSGQVIKANECIDWLIDAMECASSGNYKLFPDTEIVLDEPKNIEAEWRWFIVDGKVIDGSQYRHNGQVSKKHETDIHRINEAQRLADLWLPSKCCVMDLALVENEIKVIEFNTINSSGFYDHDVEKIIKEWYSYALKDEELVSLHF